MSVRREDAASEPAELQTGSSWIPATPGKPVCANWGENQTVQANWLEKERLASTNQFAQANLSVEGDFLQQSQRASACCASMSPDNGSRVNWSSGIPTNSHVYKESMIGFDNWVVAREAANSDGLGKDRSTYSNFSIGGPEQWTNMSFGTLLMAMGKKAAMENALAQNNFAASIASSSCGISTTQFPAQDAGSQFTMTFGDVPLQDQHTFLGANFDAEVRMPNAATGNVTIFSHSKIHASTFLLMLMTKSVIYTVLVDDLEALNFLE